MSENVRPASLLGHWRAQERERLVAAAERAHPRSYFRASEIGSDCRRKIMYSVLGFKRRPDDPKDELMFRAGDVYHALLQNKWPDTYRLEGVEAVFDADNVVWNHLQARAAEIDARLTLLEFPIKDQIDPITGEPLIIRTLEYTIPCEDDEGIIAVKVRIRPDMLITGFAGREERWDPDDWVVIDVKSTREANIKKRRQECAMQIPHVLQVQLSMYLFGIPNGGVLVIGRDNCTLLMDEYQKAYKNKSKPWAEHPEFQWQLLQLDDTIGRKLTRRLAIWERDRLRLQAIADEHGTDSEELLSAMPTFGCGGRSDWKFNYCSHSAKSTMMGQSEAQCLGGC
jgi:hypothetical protein